METDYGSSVPPVQQRPMQTNKHVLSNCNSTTALTRYTRRHNLVLEKIIEWILETKSSDQIAFADVELSSARSMGELFEPSVRPDLPVISDSRVSVLELTVCHETNLLKKLGSTNWTNTVT